MEFAERRLGLIRLKNEGYQWKSFLDRGIRQCFGSDFPVTNISPLYGIHAAITRKDPKGLPADGFLPEQAVNFATALRLFTREAAYASFLEDQIGSIEEGKLADFVVLPPGFVQDAESNPDSLLTAKILQTFLGGELVYERKK